MLRKIPLIPCIILAGAVTSLFLSAGCAKLEKPELPEELAEKIPTPGRAFARLQQLLRAKQYEKAYACFTPQYRERYAGDLETFRARAEADSAKIVAGKIAEPPRLAGNIASAVIEYGSEFISVYFVFDEASRSWLVTSQEHYRFLTDKGDQSTPEATLKSFLRFLITNRARPAYRLLATEFMMKNGIINTERFVRTVARVFLFAFQPRKGGQSWRVKHEKRAENWAAFVIEFPNNPDQPKFLCFVKKLGRWYLSIEPLGDAAEAIPFLQEYRKRYAPRKEKDGRKTGKGE